MTGSRLFSHGGLVVLLALVVLFAGCTGDDGDAGDDTDQTQDAPTGCRSQAGQAEGQSGAQIACANVRGTNTTDQAFPCPDPSQSAVGVAWNMTSGTLTIRVIDDTGAAVFEESYQQAGKGNDSARINQGETGNWTLTAEQDTAFDGSFRAQAVCSAPQSSEQGPGPSGSTVDLILGPLTTWL